MEIIYILSALHSLLLLHLTFRQDREELLNQTRYTELNRPPISEYERAYQTRIIPAIFEYPDSHTDSENKEQSKVTNGFSEAGQSKVTNGFSEAGQSELTNEFAEAEQSKAETVTDCTMLNAIHEA